MNETFFALICHENDKVRKKILAEFNAKLHVTTIIAMEVTSETLKNVFNVSSKEEKNCLLVYIEDRKQSIIDVFGKKGIPVWNLPTNTIQYRYSNGKNDFSNQFMYWEQKNINDTIRNFFIKKRMQHNILIQKVAGHTN